MANELDRLLADYVSPDRGSPWLQGVAFVVRGKGGKTLYSGSAGKSNFEPDSPAFTEDTVQWIASMTKLLTSVAALQVVEKGLIGLDDDVTTVLPELKDLPLLEGWDDEGKAKTTTQSNPITLRTLLTHSSGLGYDLFDPELTRWRQANPVEANTVGAWILPLRFKPTEGWLYGYNIDWAGQIVERLSGLSLEDYFQKHFFKVLGIESSTLEIGAHKELHPRRAAIGQRTDPSNPLTLGQGMYPDTVPVNSGGGGLYSTATDYAKFLGALLDKDKGIFEKAATYDLLNQPQLPDSKFLEEHIFGPFGPVFAPEFQGPRPTINYSPVGLVNLSDVPGKRRAGSVTWSGITNPRWWFDPASGVAGTMFTQILPPGDLVASELFNKLEGLVYQHLV